MSRRDLRIFGRLATGDAKHESVDLDFSAIAASTTDLLCIAHRDGSILWISPSVEQWTGWSASELEGFLWHSLLHPADFEQVSAAWVAGDRERHEHRMRTQSGDYRWFRSSFTALKSGSGNGHVLITSHDIDEERRKADKSHVSEIAMRRLFDSVPDAITIWRPIRNDDGQIIDLLAVNTNRAYDNVHGGYSTEGRLASACSPQTIPLVERLRNTLGSQGAAAMVVRHRGHWLDMRLTPTNEGDVVIASREVAGLSVEDTPRENGSMENAEHLARVAHTLRTNLSVVQGWCELLDEGDADPGQQQLAIANISRNTKSLLASVNTLLDATNVNGAYSLNWQFVDVASMLKLIAADVRNVHRGKEIELRLRTPLTCETNAEALETVIRHLAENAMRFAVQSVIVEAGVDSDKLVISISDDGPGIPSGLQLFTAFMPEHQGSGHGMGLNVVKKLVESMHGEITVENQRQGALFTLTLPRTAQDVSRSR